MKERDIEDDPKMDPNSTTDDRRRRKQLNCSYCRPNRGENKKNYAKHGVTKPRHKDHR